MCCEKYNDFIIVCLSNNSNNNSNVWVGVFMNACLYTEVTRVTAAGKLCQVHACTVSMIGLIGATAICRAVVSHSLTGYHTDTHSEQSLSISTL